MQVRADSMLYSCVPLGCALGLKRHCEIGPTSSVPREGRYAPLSIQHRLPRFAQASTLFMLHPIIPLVLLAVLSTVLTTEALPKPAGSATLLGRARRTDYKTRRGDSDLFNRLFVSEELNRLSAKYQMVGPHLSITKRDSASQPLTDESTFRSFPRRVRALLTVYRKLWTEWMRSITGTSTSEPRFR